MNRIPEIISGHRRPNTFASWPNMGMRLVLHNISISTYSIGRKAHMDKKYAFETHIYASPPPKSATSDGITVDVTVASSDVVRLMKERTTMMAQKRGPFWNSGALSSLLAFWSSRNASLDFVTEAWVSCCDIVRNEMRRKRRG
jgi:hypothetical protein